MQALIPALLVMAVGIIICVIYSLMTPIKKQDNDHKDNKDDVP